MPDEQQDVAGDEAASTLISLAQAAELSGFTQGHLRLLAKEGKIWATKIGRNWVTTEKAVHDYLAKERRPGPKTKDQSD